jgi:hypothetical protein
VTKTCKQDEKNDEESKEEGNTTEDDDRESYANPKRSNRMDDSFSSVSTNPSYTSSRRRSYDSVMSVYFKGIYNIFIDLFIKYQTYFISV